jgi:hypothetical protein
MTYITKSWWNLLDCPVTEVRERVRLECLDRKISRDGKTRVKLSTVMIGLFTERLKTIDLAIDRAVEDLKLDMSMVCW